MYVSTPYICEVQVDDVLIIQNSQSCYQEYTLKWNWTKLCASHINKSLNDPVQLTGHIPLGSLQLYTYCWKQNDNFDI